jgi:murein hydrolase activator
VRADIAAAGRPLPHRRRQALAAAVAVVAAVASGGVVAHRARAADVGPAAAHIADADAHTDVAAEGDRATREVRTLAERARLLGEQTGAARASARWRLHALYRLAVAGGDLPPVARARALDAVARAVARDLAEARVLGVGHARADAERATLAAAARREPEIGAPPALTPPVAGAALARFGVSTDRATGLLVSRAGVRLAATPGQAVRAPALGVVAAVRVEAIGVAIVLDHGAGWTTIVGGLAAAVVSAGDRVAAGQRLGVAAAGPAPAIELEVWRGSHPVDPALLLRAPLAAPAALP